MEPARNPSVDRRTAVLESALETFARTGFRGTSMNAVAQAARISRPGLYLMFESKEALFRESVSHVLSQDLALIEGVLDDSRRSLRDRVVESFDLWAGRYVGTFAHDLPSVISDHPNLLDGVARRAPDRFEALLSAALAERHPADHRERAQTLISASAGLKHQTSTREDYLRRLRVAVDVLVDAP